MVISKWQQQQQTNVHYAASDGWAKVSMKKVLIYEIK